MGLMKTDIEKIENRIQIFEQENPNPVMSKEKQIEKFKKICKDYNVPDELLDLEMLVDSTLQFSENKTQILPLIETLASSQNTEDKIIADKKVKKKSIREEKLEQERINLDNIRQEIEYTQAEFKKSLETLQANNKILEKLYWLPKQYIKAVVNPNNELYGLILSGQAGCSKSYSTIQTLNEIKADYVYFSGYITPLGLYEFLYENRQKGKTIVFDDTFGILTNPTSIMIMINALYSSSGIRKIFWNSSIKKIKIPNEFIFEANVILITNQFPKNIGIDLINSRCLCYEFKFKNSEILEIMKAIAKLPHPKLSKEEREEIVKFIEENTDETIENFDLRIQNKIENLYLYSKEKWKELSMPLFKKNEKIWLLKQVLNKCSTIKEALSEYNKALEERGINPVCRKTFYNYKNKLVNW